MGSGGPTRSSRSSSSCPTIGGVVEIEHTGVDGQTQERLDPPLPPERGPSSGSRPVVERQRTDEAIAAEPEGRRAGAVQRREAPTEGLVVPGRAPAGLDPRAARGRGSRREARRRPRAPRVPGARRPRRASAGRRPRRRRARPALRPASWRTPCGRRPDRASSPRRRRRRRWDGRRRRQRRAPWPRRWRRSPQVRSVVGGDRRGPAPTRPRDGPAAPRQADSIRSNMTAKSSASP